MDELNCKTEGWAPLGQANSDLFKEEIIRNLSQKFKKTPAQIILRWHIQMGHIIFPKSSNPVHLKENFEIFDFQLTEEDMKAINDLDGKKGRVQYNSFLLNLGLWLMPAPKD